MIPINDSPPHSNLRGCCVYCTRRPLADAPTSNDLAVFLTFWVDCFISLAYSQIARVVLSTKSGHSVISTEFQYGSPVATHSLTMAPLLFQSSITRRARA